MWSSLLSLNVVVYNSLLSPFFIHVCVISVMLRSDAQYQNVCVVYTHTHTRMYTMNVYKGHRGLSTKVMCLSLLKNENFILLTQREGTTLTCKPVVAKWNTVSLLAINRVMYIFYLKVKLLELHLGFTLLIIQIIEDEQHNNKQCMSNII